MDRNQMNNIIGFVFKFHQQCLKWEEQNPSYIKEKWDKYIGVNAISNFIDGEYYNTTEILRNDKINKWIKMWKVSEKDF